MTLIRAKSGVVVSHLKFYQFPASSIASKRRIILVQLLSMSVCMWRDMSELLAKKYLIRLLGNVQTQACLVSRVLALRRLGET